MTPQEFIAKWQDNTFGEKQGSQEMFIDICHLVGHPTPGELGNKDVFTFEKTVPTGTPDAYLQGHFGWEFKGSDAQLDGALLQLLRYQVYLQTPPLLIVSSFKTIRIRTNFPGMETVLHEIPVSDLDQPDYLVKLKNVFFEPNQFRPNRSLEDVTRETAGIFGKIVADMEARGHDPGILARYLNQIIFCLYAEDAGLLPGNLFTRIVGQHFKDPVLFNQAVTGLFTQMASGGLFGADEIPYFNGDLFNDVDPVELSSTALFLLEQASKKNWRNIEPSIFGTLFERALDASQRSQLGAHYTSASDIMLVVDPVVMEPLRREWDAVRQDVSNLLAEEDRNTSYVRLRAFQQRLFEVHVLDPACGSGNFLYLALRSLLDFEKTVIDFAAEHGWLDFTPTVKPDQMLGLEISPYAVALARTSLWIGYIQWHQANGFPYTQSPILTPLVTVQQTDSILDLSDPDNPCEPEWPQAEFIIGNPPFLGGKLLRSQLGDPYVDSLFSLYEDRVPAESDLVCYWFEKGRAVLEKDSAKRVGLLGTQGIRDGRDITSRPRGMWIIDFGDMVSEQAALYESPFEYVNTYVRPTRINNKRKLYAENWWLHVEPRPGLRLALQSLPRYIATPTLAKHRLFVRLSTTVLPDHQLIAVAHHDDYTFGVLHSSPHELWALAMGTQLESRPRYTPTTCFETFPFPEPTDEQRESIAAAARELDELRNGWLNPPNASTTELKKRTLTNLYNQPPSWLQLAHEKLDVAVAAAYGWPSDLPDTEILERLLALNLQRAAAQ